MTTEQPKAAPAQEQQPYPPGAVPYPHHMGPFPHGAPGHYPYISGPPPEGSPGENGQNGAPGFMMFHPPPGMVYYQGSQAPGFSQAQNAPVPAALSRAKRKQVKMACTNCATACKRCDETRPCQRCVKYNIAEACIDGQRKERKKGIKRGPYKRKNKMNDDSPSFSEPAAETRAWSTPAPPPPAPAPATTAAAIQAVSQFVPGEGFYPMYYPPPGFMPPPPPHDGQPGMENGAPHPNGPPPHMPYFMPGPYPPFPYPGYMHGPPPPHAAYHPHIPPQPPLHAQAQPQPQSQPPQVPPPVNAAADPPVAAKPPSEAVSANSNDANNVTGVVAENGASGKKRGRAPKNGAEPKKKAKRGAKGPKDDTVVADEEAGATEAD